MMEVALCAAAPPIVLSHHTASDTPPSNTLPTCGASSRAQTARAKKDAPPESATHKVLAEEADMMRHITQKTALRAVKELATDTVYIRSMRTGWRPPAEAREAGSGDGEGGGVVGMASGAELSCLSGAMNTPTHTPCPCTP
jgi:hypothetical protein